MDIEVEAGMHGGHPRTWHGSKKGVVHVEENDTVATLQKKIQDLVGEPVALIGFEGKSSQTVSSVGIKNGATVRAQYTTRFD